MTDGQSGKSKLLPVAGNDKALEAKLEGDPCFGKHFTKTAEECKRCRMPVIKDGELLLLREVCRGICEDTSPGPLRRLTSQEVFDRFTQDQDIEEVWLEILDGKDPDSTYGSEARALLQRRCKYLREEKGVQVPEVPYTKTLRQHIGEDT